MHDAKLILSPLLTSFLLLAGCTAALGDSDPSSDADVDDGAPTDAGLSDTDLPVSVDATGEACTVAPGPGVIRRLTESEYHATLTSLLGAGYPDDAPLSGNSIEGGYSTRSDGLMVRDLGAQAISNHADAIAQWAVETNPASLTACAELSDACAEQTVRDFGRRAFQKPLSEELVTRYKSLFLQGASFSDALQMTVSTMLQSPYFLYRREFGTDAAEYAALTDHELGSALSYFVTGGPPDAELSAIIDGGSLREEATWSAQVDRLLDSPAAEKALTEFIIEWLKLDEVLSRTKNEAGVEVTDTLRTSMMEEVRELVRHVYRTGGGAAELIENESVFLNAELAAHYGMPGPPGELFEPVPADNRTGGLLGTGAYLLGHSTVDSSSPTTRGLFIRERLLCLDVPPPPPAVNTDLPAASGPMTTRERFSAHLVDPVCATCHESIDTFGFAFEGYDGLGRHRIDEGGLPVDTTGTTVGLEAGDVAFAGPQELVSTLAAADQVDRCFHQHLVEYTTGQASWDNLCSVNQVATATATGSLKDSLRSILALPHLQARLAQGAL